MPAKSLTLGLVLFTSCAAVLLAGCTVNGGTTAVAAMPEPAPGGQWATLPTDDYRGKRDDIVFVNATTGFYGTGAGDLFKTADGGATWTRIWSKPGTFIRALGFIDERRGFLGNVGDAYPTGTDKTPLYETRDGGATWTPVNLDGATIPGICAIDVLRTQTIYQGALRDRAIVHAAGRVSGPAKLLRSVDGGDNWSVIDMSDKAGMILDVKFLDANTGFVFAGTSSDTRRSEALILKTRDGGLTWKEVYRSGRKLENSWKASFADARTGYATVQTYDPAREQQVIVKTVDGGDSWTELPLVMDAKARQFGIGFPTARTGWVGTAVGGFETRDGGATWTQVPLAPAANKIRTRASDGTPMVYAIGTAVQRFAAPAGSRMTPAR
jgi:photosystem II stability/assembly factor-like uncharacterized protein